MLQVQAVPGTSLPEMTRIGGEISKLVMAKADVATVELQVGRAEIGGRYLGTEPFEFHVELKAECSRGANRRS